MANALGIVEVTLKQAADATHPVNQSESHRHTIIRITDHASDVPAEANDAMNMAIFTREALGMPWRRKGTKLAHPVHKTVDPATDVIPTNVEVLYPNHDYAQFQ